MNTRSNIGMVVEDAHDNIFEAMNFHYNKGSGFFIDAGTGGHLILNCDSHDNYDPNSSQGGGQNADGFGVHYQTTGKPTTFTGCRAWWPRLHRRGSGPRRLRIRPGFGELPPECAFLSPGLATPRLPDRRVPQRHPSLRVPNPSWDGLLGGKTLQFPFPQRTPVRPAGFASTYREFSVYDCKRPKQP